MQIEALVIFCDVVRHASFSRAAAENGMSQSSASQAVQTLEELLGVKLIDRSRRPLKPTERGRIFYDGCRDLLGRYEDLVRKIQASEPGEAIGGTVRLSAIYSVGLHGLTRHIERFREHCPAADCRLECMHPGRVLESVREGTADLGVISCPRKWPDLTVVPWREEEMVVVAPPGHPLADGGPIQVGALDGQKFVHFDADLPIRREIDRFLRRRGVHVDTVLTFDNIENIKRAVEVGAGLAILPRPSLSRELASGSLRVRPLADHRLVRPIALIHRGASSLGAAATHLLDELMSELDADPSRVSAASTKSGGWTDAGNGRLAVSGSPADQPPTNA